jgi:hypothetical protein
MRNLQKDPLLKDLKEEVFMSPDQKAESYGKGPWTNEPDKVTFAYDGFECEINRDVALGFLVGKIFVPSKFGGGCVMFSRDKVVDIMPKLSDIKSLMKIVMESVDKEVTYKDVDFCIEECKRIVRETKEECAYVSVFV